MGIKSTIKKIFLMILLVFVSLILGAIGLFSEHLGGKSQAQAQCWTAPPGGGGSSCGMCTSGGSCSCSCACGTGGCACGTSCSCACGTSCGCTV